MKKWLVRLSVVVIAGWLVASATLFPAMAISVGENPVTETPAELNTYYEDIRVTSEGGIELAGWWIPAQNPRAVLLFSHGAGSNRTSWFLPSLEFYSYLAQEGISVITVDMRNHGNSPKTTGKLGMGAAEWPDALAMAQWLDDNGHTGLPRVAMGVSMSGATSIYAIKQGLKVDALVLMDPALNTRDALAQGGWIQFGLPPLLFKPYAWSTTAFWGLPSGELDASAQAANLTLPTLLIQDPTDPITRLPFAQALAETNPAIELAVAPVTAAEDQCLAGKGRWGSHVAAFKCHPSWTKQMLMQFFTEKVFEQPLGG